MGVSPFATGGLMINLMAILLVLLAVPMASAADVAGINGVYSCDDGGKLSVVKQRMPDRYHASLEYPDGSSSTLAEFEVEGKSRKGKMLRDDEDPETGEFTIKKGGDVLVLSFNSGDVVTCTAQSTAPLKICFGSGDVKGERFNLTATKKKATISNWVSTRFDWPKGQTETYPFIEEKKARNGDVFFTYQMPSDDANNTLFVDEGLLLLGTEGLVKIQSKGEGFIQDTFFCKETYK